MIKEATDVTRKINFRKIETMIPEDIFISNISGIIGEVKNVTLEGKFHNMKVYEIEDTMFVLVQFVDCSGTIPAVFVGNRNNEFKSFVEDIIMNTDYRISGNVSLLDDDFLEEALPFQDEIKGNKLFCITALQDLSSIRLFGVDIVKLYDYDLNKAYDFVNDNTDYLKGISVDEVKDIEFSCNKDVIILLHNGIVLLNGKEMLENVKAVVFINGGAIFAITNNNVIIPVVGICNSTKCINNNNHEYKKIIITPLVIVALTFEKDIKLFGMVCEGFIDYHRFFDVDDIGYVEENDDIVVIKDGKVYSLFHENDYSNELPDVLVKGSTDTLDIIE